MSVRGRFFRMAVTSFVLGWCSVGALGWTKALAQSPATPVVPPRPVAAWAPTDGAQMPALVSDERAAELAGMGLEALFAQAVLPGTLGDDYTAVREEILSRPGALEFVTAKATRPQANEANGARPPSLEEARSRALAQAMLLWASDENFYAVRTAYVLQALMDSTKEKPSNPSVVSSVVSPMGYADLLADWGPRHQQVPPGPGSRLVHAAKAGGPPSPEPAPGPPVGLSWSGPADEIGALIAAAARASALSTATLTVPDTTIPDDEEPFLLEMALKGPSSDVRAQLAIVPQARPLWFFDWPPITDAAGYRSWARSYAASRLWISSEPEILPILIDLLRSDPDRAVRASAASGLIQRGSDAVEPLLDALRDSERAVREVANNTLGRITRMSVYGMPPWFLADAEVKYRAWWAQNEVSFRANDSVSKRKEVHW